MFNVDITSFIIQSQVQLLLVLPVLHREQHSFTTREEMTTSTQLLLSTAGLSE